MVRQFLCCVLLPWVLCAGLAACSGTDGPVTGPLTAREPDTPLPTTSPDAAGVRDAWDRALAAIEAEGMAIDEWAVLVDGKSVGSLHRNGFGPGTLHDLRSATKTVTGLLVGIAIDRGLIASVDEPVARFFPEHASRIELAPVTLRHLLTMRSGLDCDDWRAESPGNEERMYGTGDWTAFYFDIPVLSAPGGAFSYCTAGVVLLGEVVARAAGRPLPDFARETLFEPLGIRNAVWAPAGTSGTDAGGHLRLSLASLLKLGELVRVGGSWEGQPIVSPEWLQASTASAGPIAPAAPTAAHMGRLWWLEPVEDGIARSWQARGNGGQLLVVVPEVGLVAAATGHAYNAPPELQWAAFSLLSRWFIPALRARPATPVS